MNNDDIIKKILQHAKPDQIQAMEALKKANDTISMLINQLKVAETRWTEIFIMLGTVLNKFGREIVIKEEDMVALDSSNYKITVEPDDKNNVRIMRLRHVSDAEEEK